MRDARMEAGQHRSTWRFRTPGAEEGGLPPHWSSNGTASRATPRNTDSQYTDRDLCRDRARSVVNPLGAPDPMAGCGGTHALAVVWRALARALVSQLAKAAARRRAERAAYSTNRH